jgi:hypothetical protein
MTADDHHEAPRKKPEAEVTSAAGKCLIKMDLPLARREPSPPHRLRKALRLAGRSPIALPNPGPERPLSVQAPRARFEFVARTHRKRIHTPRFQPVSDCPCVRLPNGSNYIAVFAATTAVICRAHYKVKQRMTLRVIFLIFFLNETVSWRRRPCPSPLGLGGGILRRRERDNSSKRSPAWSSPALVRRGRWRAEVLPVRQRFR